MKCQLCQKVEVTNLSLWDLFIAPLKMQGLCQECQNHFQRISPTKSCPGCSKPEQPTLCNDCLIWQANYPNYDFQHLASFQYNEAFKNWLYRYKFLGDKGLASSFDQIVKKTLAPFSEYIICPIPLSKERLAIRGFNQTTALLESCNLSYQELLFRYEHTQPQAEKNRRERLKLQQPFELAVGNSQISGKKILLFDDVYTTGRTLFHAAEKIAEANPEKIVSYSLAR